MGLREWWNALKTQPEVRVEVSSGIYVQQEDPEITRGRRAATIHAQAGDYTAAVADLERVRNLECADGSNADCASEIRRAKYLQKAGRGYEAWQIFQRLLAKHRNYAWLIIDLLNAMRLHLQREGRPSEAIHYGVAFRLARIKLYQEWKTEAQTALASPVESYGSKDLEKLIRENQRGDIELCDRWLGELTDIADIKKLAKTLCKKAGEPEQADALVERLEREIERRTGPFDYLEAEGGGVCASSLLT